MSQDSVAMPITTILEEPTCNLRLYRAPHDPVDKPPVLQQCWSVIRMDYRTEIKMRHFEWRDVPTV